MHIVEPGKHQTLDQSSGCKVSFTEQVEGVEQGPYRAVGTALEVIPRTLAQNCGANVIRTLTKLRAKHADSSDCTFGLNGNTGEIVDMKELGVWEPYAVKVSASKHASYAGRRA